MKKLVCLALSFAMMTGVLTGCGGGSASGTTEGEDKKLYVYTWSEYIPQSVYDQFEEETGIDVVETTFSSNEEMLAKLVAGGSDQYDLIVASNYVIPAMQEQNLIKELDVSKVENFANLYDIYKGMDFDPENKYSIPYMSTMTVIAVNKAKCQELGVEIKNFNDLTNPKLEQNLVAVDDCREIVGIGLKAVGADPDSTDEATIKSAEPYLKELAKNIKIYDSDTPFSALATNDVAAGIVYNMDAALAMAENPDIDVVYTEEPCEISYDNFVLSASSVHQEEAQEFINFIHRPEIYSECLTEFPSVCLNEKAFDEMDDSFKNNKAANCDQNEIARAHVIGDVGSAASIYDEVFSGMKQ